MIVSHFAQLVADDSPRVLSTHVIAETLSILQRGRPNVLVIGHDDVVDSFLEQIGPHLVPPVARWNLRDGATWPATPFRTLIVRHVDALNLAQQERLTDLPADVQIISATTASLFPAVRRGAFSDRLYYRLNTILHRLPFEHCVARVCT